MCGKKLNPCFKIKIRQKKSCIVHSRHVTMQRVKLLVDVTVPRCVTEVMYKMLHPCPGYYGIGRGGETTQSTSSSNQEIGRGKRKGKTERKTERRKKRKNSGVKTKHKKARGSDLLRKTPNTSDICSIWTTVMFTMQNIHSLKWSQLYSCKTKLLVSSSILHDIHLNPPLKKVKKKKKKQQSILRTIQMNDFTLSATYCKLKFCKKYWYKFVNMNLKFWKGVKKFKTLIAFSPQSKILSLIYGSSFQVKKSN